MQAKNDGLALVMMFLPTNVSGLSDAELLPKLPQTLFNLSLNFIWGCENILNNIVFTQQIDFYYQGR